MQKDSNFEEQRQWTMETGDSIQKHYGVYSPVTINAKEGKSTKKELGFLYTLNQKKETKESLEMILPLYV